MFLKKALSVFCVLSLVICAVPVMKAGAWNVPEEVDGVYQISNLDELYWFAAQVNGGNTGINGLLTDDIVVNESVLSADGNLNSVDYQIWTPIGYCVPSGSQRLYTGTFDGDGKTISGLFFDYSGGENIGLFGCIGPGGLVMNVNISDSYFLARGFVGGIAGANGGIIQDCIVDATVVSMEDCAGGVAGVSYGEVLRCGSLGMVVAGGNDAGGVVGNNSGAVSNCYNVGSIAADGFCAGGVVGFNSRFVVDSFHAGEITEGATQGGITGGNIGFVENCYYRSGSAPASQEGIVQTAEEFASGQVCFQLQGQQAKQIWGQRIGKEAVPGFSDDVVYPVLDENEEVIGYENAPVPGVTVSGKVESYIAEGEITLELIRDGEVLSTVTHVGQTVSYAFMEVEAGSYVVRISKENHTTREYELVVGEEDVELDMKICPKGDVTGDGAVTIKDFQRLLRHVNRTAPLEGYALACGNVTNDNTCNIKDFQRLLKHINRTSLLF